MTPPTSSGGTGTGGGNSDEIFADTVAADVVGKVGRGGAVVEVVVATGTVFGATGPHPVERAIRIRTKAN